MAGRPAVKAQAQRGAVLARQESLELKDAHFLNLVRCGVNLAPCAGAEQGAEQGAAPAARRSLAWDDGPEASQPPRRREPPARRVLPLDDDLLW